MAPPVSQDQFKLLCPQWSKEAENNSRPVTVIAAQAAQKAILSRLDTGLVAWGSGAPSRKSVRTLLKVAAALIAQQRVAPDRRTLLANEQEYAVFKLLLDDGWTRLPSKQIDTRGEVPSKHFMHKTRFATKSRPQEVDVACGLKGTPVLRRAMRGHDGARVTVPEIRCARKAVQRRPPQGGRRRDRLSLQRDWRSG